MLIWTLFLDLVVAQTPESSNSQFSFNFGNSISSGLGFFIIFAVAVTIILCIICVRRGPNHSIQRSDVERALYYHQNQVHLHPNQIPSPSETPLYFGEASRDNSNEHCHEPPAYSKHEDSLNPT